MQPEVADPTSDVIGPLAGRLEEPLLLIDVGCRDGEAASWRAFDPNVRVVGFEPDAEECARLEDAYDGPADRTFVPVALGAHSGQATLHVTKYPQSSSLLEPDPETIAHHPALAAHEVAGRRTVALSRLDTWWEEAGQPRVDFLTIDVQGVELHVLRGAERALGTVRAVQVEVAFQRLYRDQPRFGEVDSFMRDRGFLLWRLRDLRHLALAGIEGGPQGLGESRLPDAVEAEPSGGRLSWADAVYVRADLGEPPGPWTEPLRDAFVAAALGLPELAQTGLATADSRAPAAERPAIERALARVRSAGRGRPKQASELEYLRAQLAAQIGAAGEGAARIEELEAERRWAFAELESLRHRLARYEGGAELPGAVRRMLARADGVARRLRWWTTPRLGVLKQHAPSPVLVPRPMASLRPPREAPSISIVTPSLNQSHFIERTLRSVLGQGYPALEYVVQDGGSEDGTRAVLDAYRDRITDCVSERDDGQADALNRGFARTSGEIMGWINSDDVLLPGALAAVARHFASHPETDLVYGHRLLIDADDRLIGSWIMPRHEDWTLDFADVVPQETMFWRRRIWDASGARLDTAYHYALDWELLLRFRDAGARMVRLPLPLAGFRIHDRQKTSFELDRIGHEEMSRLRRGGAAGLSFEEAWMGLRPYLRRHVAHHTLYRLLIRIPALSVEVDVS